MSPQDVNSDSRGETRSAHGRSAAARWTLRVLATVALAGASYLAWMSLLAGPDALLGCVVDLPYFNCEHVLTSPWSYWLGIPVSVVAVGVYVAILTASLLIGPTRRPRIERAARGLLRPLVAMAAGAAAWFLGLMLFVIGDLCLQCLIVHACGLTIATLVFAPELLSWAFVRRGKKRARRRQAALGALAGRGANPPTNPSPTVATPGGRWLPALGLAAVAMLIAGQILFPAKEYRMDSLAGTSVADSPAQPQPADRPSEDPAQPLLTVDPPTPTPSKAGTVAYKAPMVVDGKLELDPHAHPILGDPDAKYVLVKLFDYTCKHCRKLHRQLEQSRERYGSQFAIVVLPVPMNSKCHKRIRQTHPDHEYACEHARLAMALWHLAPAKFPEYHLWILDQSQAPPLYRAENKVADLLEGTADRATFKKEANGPAVKQRIDGYTGLFGQCGGGVIPKTIVARSQVITGEPKNAQEFFDRLEEILDIKPVSQ
ncbi:MAG: thioredoxin domain-containing protein [Candidatus Nealsonbacteria bacterium]|nr:thioredoxin domain-containing protein [Candidatus Nealsonbacteria bacterium]